MKFDQIQCFIKCLEDLGWESFGRSDSELAVHFGSTHSSRRPNLFAPVHPIPPFFVAPKPSDLVSSSKENQQKNGHDLKKHNPNFRHFFAVQKSLKTTIPPYESLDPAMEG